jgi:hypothetical protein
MLAYGHWGFSPQVPQPGSEIIPFYVALTDEKLRLAKLYIRKTFLFHPKEATCMPRYMIPTNLTITVS